MGSLYKEFSIEVVQLILNKADGSGTDTYNLSTSYYAANEIYSGSAEVLPLLSAEPQVRRGVGLNAGVRFDVAINIHAHAHFQQYGESFYALRDTYEFTSSTAKILYYPKAWDGQVSHADATNIRQVLTIKNVSYDNNGSIMRIIGRDAWFRDKDLGIQLESSDYTELDDSFDGAYGAICFGEACDFNAAVTFRDANSITMHAGFEFTNHEGHNYDKFFVRNRQQRERREEWSEISLNNGSNRNTSGAFYGRDLTATEDATYNMRTDARAVVVSPSETYLLAGVGIRASLTGTVAPSVGKLSCSIYLVNEYLTLTPHYIGSPVWQGTTETSGFTYMRTHLFTSETPVLLHAGLDYMVVFEWSNRDDTVNYPNMAAKIQVGTNHYKQDRTVREAGWTAVVDRELQMEMWAFDSITQSHVADPGFYELTLGAAINPSTAAQPLIQCKIRVKGLEDDASGTYTGSANALITNPADVIRFVLQNSEFGLGLSNVDTAAFNSIRNTIEENFDISAVINRKMKAQEFILKICRQCRMVIHTDNQGRVTAEFPQPLDEAALDFDFNEGELQGELEVVSVIENDAGSVINACKQQTNRDPFRTATDLELATQQLVAGEKFSETVRIDASTSYPTDLSREAKASASQALYSRRERTEPLDFFNTAVGDGLHAKRAMNYYFDRYHEPVQRVQIRLPRRDWYDSIKLFNKGRVRHSGLSDKTGTERINRAHEDGKPVYCWESGLPCVVISLGSIMGEVIELVESGQFIEAVVETMLPFEGF